MPVHCSAWLQVTYEFRAGGSLAMHWHVDTTKFLPKKLQGQLNSLPRIGVELALPDELRQCAWFGRCARSHSDCRP